MTFDELPESPQPGQPTPSIAPMPPMSPVQPVVPKKRAGGSSGSLLLALAAIVAVGGIAFAAGRLTAPASTTGRGGAGFPGGFQGGYPGASFVPGASFAPDASGRPGGIIGPGGAQMTLTGTVSAISGDTLTLTTAEGRTIEVSVGDATWHTQESASASEAAVGSKVMIQLSGAGGFGRDPGAGQDPAASAAPGAGSLSASDVTILQK